MVVLDARVDIGDDDAFASVFVVLPDLVGLDVLHAPLGGAVLHCRRLDRGLRLGLGGPGLDVVELVVLILDDARHVRALRQLLDEFLVSRNPDRIGDPEVLVADLVLVEEGVQRLLALVSLRLQLVERGLRPRGMAALALGRGEVGLVLEDDEERGVVALVHGLQQGGVDRGGRATGGGRGRGADQQARDGERSSHPCDGSPPGRSGQVHRDAPPDGTGEPGR
ncbi:hypothetical protein [Streptomyces sp. WAC 04229]|uniref:hypothetical protein n=1 Tax=Streptomyces sp. WAC 04229 TaxID=2203206 RepID=UPI00163D3BF4|nr:hypothetical protein [Streptomyces sp. WAC 04229]